LTPDLQLALTRAAVLSLVGTSAERDVWMSEPADDLGGGVPAALIATGQGELVLDCVAAWAAGETRSELTAQAGLSSCPRPARWAGRAREDDGYHPVRAGEVRPPTAAFLDRPPQAPNHQPGCTHFTPPEPTP
jgi:hypothetical protein